MPSCSNCTSPFSKAESSFYPVLRSLFLFYLRCIEFTCFDGDQCYTQSLCLTNTGVNTSRLNRLEHFVNDFDREGKFMTGEELHSHLDEIERIHGLYSPIALAYAVLIILVATMTAWIMALLLHLQPVQFPALSLTLPEEIVFRLLASFGGVFGFSLMFNSPRNLAVCAALIGAVTNTFRLELVSLAGFPPAIAAFPFSHIRQNAANHLTVRCVLFCCDALIKGVRLQGVYSP